MARHSRQGRLARIYSLYTEVSGSLHFSTGPSGSYIGDLSTGKLTLNEWIHVAAVVDGEHRFYINGDPAGVSGTGAYVPAGSTADLTIGRTDESNREFQGMIDDVWIFDVALTDDQVKASTTAIRRGGPRRPIPTPRTKPWES